MIIEKYVIERISLKYPNWDFISSSFTKDSILPSLFIIFNYKEHKIYLDYYLDGYIVCNIYKTDGIEQIGFANSIEEKLFEEIDSYLNLNQ